MNGQLDGATSGVSSASRQPRPLHWLQRLDTCSCPQPWGRVRSGSCQRPFSMRRRLRLGVKVRSWPTHLLAGLFFFVFFFNAQDQGHMQLPLARRFEPHDLGPRGRAQLWRSLIRHRKSTPTARRRASRLPSFGSTSAESASTPCRGPACRCRGWPSGGPAASQMVGVEMLLYPPSRTRTIAQTATTRKVSVTRPATHARDIAAHDRRKPTPPNRLPPDRLAFPRPPPLGQPRQPHCFSPCGSAPSSPVRSH